MQGFFFFFNLVRKIPILLKTYISPHILQDMYQFITVKGKRITKSFPLEVHITEHCNLNCKGCNHFSSLAREEYLEPADYEKDIARLSQLTKSFFAIKLLGGEPLLHPKVTDFFDITRKYYPKTPVQITTNGILLTKQPEQFWQSCRKNNIMISISQYPIVLDRKAIKNIAKKYQVKIENNGTTSEDRMCKIPLDLTGGGAGQNMYSSFKNCIISWGCCVTLRESRLYTCCIVAHIKFFNQYFNQELKVSENDYLDINKINSKNEIIDFLEKPFPFCRYCKTKEIQFGQKWSVSKKEMSEWI